MVFVADEVKSQSIDKSVEAVLIDSKDMISLNEIVKLPSFGQLQNVLKRTAPDELELYLTTKSVNKLAACILSLAYRDTTIEKFIELHKLLISAWKTQKLTSEIFNEFVYRCGVLKNGRLANIHKNPQVVILIDNMAQENINRKNELIWLRGESLESLRSGYWRRQLRSEVRLNPKNTSLNILNDSDNQAGYISNIKIIENIKESPYPWFISSIIMLIITIILFIKKNWLYAFLSICGLFGFCVLAWLVSFTSWVVPL